MTDFVGVRLTVFETGCLMGLLEREEAWRKESPLNNLYNQLVSVKRQIEESCGVRKEQLPNGLLRISDKDGNVIIRPRYQWEKAEGTERK